MNQVFLISLRRRQLLVNVAKQLGISKVRIY